MFISEKEEDPDFFKFKFGEQDELEKEDLDEMEEEMDILDEEGSSADKEVDQFLAGSLKQILKFDNVTYVSLIKKEGKLMGEVKEEGSEDSDFYYSSLSTAYTATMGQESDKKVQYMSIAMPDCYYLLREMNEEYIFALRLDSYDNFTDIMEKLDEEGEFLKDKWTRIHTISQLRRKYDFN